MVLRTAAHLANRASETGNGVLSDLHRAVAAFERRAQHHAGGLCGCCNAGATTTFPRTPGALFKCAAVQGLDRDPACSAGVSATADREKTIYRRAAFARKACSLLAGARETGGAGSRDCVQGASERRPRQSEQSTAARFPAVGYRVVQRRNYLIRNARRICRRATRQ